MSGCQSHVSSRLGSRSADRPTCVAASTEETHEVSTCLHKGRFSSLMCCGSCPHRRQHTIHSPALLALRVKLWVDWCFSWVGMLLSRFLDSHSDWLLMFSVSDGQNPSTTWFSSQSIFFHLSNHCWMDSSISSKRNTTTSSLVPTWSEAHLDSARSAAWLTGIDTAPIDLLVSRMECLLEFELISRSLCASI